MSGLPGIVLTAVLLGANAFFVGAEFALVSARRSQIEPRAEAGSWAARITLRAMERVSLMMAGAQLGITVCSLALGAVSEPAIAHLVEAPFAAAGLPGGWLHPASFVIALGLVTFLHVVLGEMVPKNLALAMPERVVLVLAPALVGVVKVLHPLIWSLNVLANGVLKLLQVAPRDEVASAFTRDEVALMVGESRANGLLDAREEELLMEALEFDELEARGVMVPLEEVVALPAGSTPAQAEEVAVAGFSRFPVRDGDDLVGYVHVKDLLDADAETRHQPLSPAVVRPLLQVPGRAHLRAVLTEMQYSGAHLAAVVEHGEVLGVVALEDVLAELVGQIRHEG